MDYAPVQYSDLKFARVHTIVALNEGIAKVVDAEMHELLKSTVVKIQVIRISLKCKIKADILCI